MIEQRSREDATLLDVLVDGFEKNELIEGFFWRQLPMSDEAAAVRKFVSLSDEARRWRGAPTRVDERHGRRLAVWPDLEIRLAGRGVLVRVRAPLFEDWWHDERTWHGDPMGPVFDWIASERQPG